MNAPAQVGYGLLTGETSFAELYEIYMQSMPASERKDRAGLAAMCGRADYRVLVAERANRVIGFSILFVPPGENFSLLEYLAVEAKFRSEGVGAELFRRCVDPDRTMLLEVDSAGEDMGAVMRREQFYRRLGCLKVDGLRYLLPLRSSGAPPEMGMLARAPQALMPLRKGVLEDWLKVIYQQVYGCAADDPRIAAMLAGVEDPVRLV